MTAAERVLDQVRRALVRTRAAPALSIAFSGGMDSSVLLEAVRRLGAAPRALHVDHGLDPRSADWLEHCRRQCEARGIAFRGVRVDARPGPGASPEEAARDARYAALAAALSPGEVLCTAHHADDQAETVLLNLLRGGGLAGTAAMRPERDFPPGRLVRPLLEVSRRDIARAAAAWCLEWIEDPANTRLAHPRNRLRLEVMPRLQAIAPAAVPALARSAALHREAVELLDDVAAQDLASCRAVQRPAPTHAARAPLPASALSRRALAALGAARRRAVLRLWLRQQGLRPPARARLEELERQLLDAGPDRSPRVALSGAEVRVHGDHTLLFPGPAPAALEGCRRWQPGTVLELPSGTLWAEATAGAGLRGDGPLEVRGRAGGERCRPSGRRHGQTLKRLLQELGVPAWERAGLPLVYRGGELAAVADLFVCHGHESAPGERGWRVRWEPRERALDAAAPGVGRGSD